MSPKSNTATPRLRTGAPSMRRAPPSAGWRSMAIASLAAALVALGVAGCESGGASDAGGTGGGPAYLVHSAVQTTQGRTNYFTVVSSILEQRELDYSTSLEVPGRARLYAEPGVGFFAIGGGEDVAITRYELAEDGTFVPGERMSLQAHGVTSMGPQAVLFVSPTKAYYKDDGQGQIIVWNPTSMTIDRSIPLPSELYLAERLTTLSQWASRGTEAYFAVGWTTEVYDRVYPGAVLVRIDTATDELTVTQDDRCRGLFKTAAHAGTLYFFSNVINGFGYAVHGDEGGQQDCILRISPGETTFDADWVGSVAPALEPEEIGTGIAVTAGGRAWYQVVDTTMVPTAPGSTYGQWYAAGWTWASVDLATLAARVSVPGAPGAYAGNAFVSGSDIVIAQTAPDYSSTTLVNLTGAEPEPGLSFPGFTLDVAQLR